MQNYVKFNTRSGVLPMDFIMRKFDCNYSEQDQQEEIRQYSSKDAENGGDSITSLIKSVLDESELQMSQQESKINNSTYVPQNVDQERSALGRSFRGSQNEFTRCRQSFLGHLSASDALLELQDSGTGEIDYIQDGLGHVQDV